MPHQYVCVYRWFESDCQQVQKSLLLTSHIGLSAASHKLRCKASESNCQVVCLLVFGGGLSVQCRTRAGPWHTPSKQKSKLVCMLISTFKLFDEHFRVLHGWLIGKSCVEYSKDSCSPTHPNPTHHTSHTNTYTPLDTYKEGICIPLLIHVCFLHLENDTQNNQESVIHFYLPCPSPTALCVFSSCCSV